MKRILSGLALALLMLAPLGLVTATTGCSAPQSAIAYKTIASVQSAVQTSLDAWSEYVANRKREISAMPEGAEQSAAVIQLANRELKARAALEAYKTAAVAAITVARSGSAPAPSALISAASQFTSVTTN